MARSCTAPRRAKKRSCATRRPSHSSRRSDSVSCRLWSWAMRLPPPPNPPRLSCWTSFGIPPSGEPWGRNPYGENVLIAGPSGSGKSNLALGVLERLVEREYQFCVLDPEGDYETFQPAAALGNKEGAPSVDEVLRVLEN